MQTFYIYSANGKYSGTIDAIDLASAIQLAKQIYGDSHIVERFRRFSPAA